MLDVYVRYKKKSKIIKIESKQHFLLKACMCNPYGSIRDDCSQEDGRCYCKEGSSGPKCSVCDSGSELTQYGCKFKDSTNVSVIPYGTQKCLKDYDCGVNMECLAGICYCLNGFIPENNYCVRKYLF